MAALSYLLDFFFCLGDWCIWVFPSYDSYVFQYSLLPVFAALTITGTLIQVDMWTKRNGLTARYMEYGIWLYGSGTRRRRRGTESVFGIILSFFSFMNVYGKSLDFLKLVLQRVTGMELEGGEWTWIWKWEFEENSFSWEVYVDLLLVFFFLSFSFLFCF